MKIIMKHYYKAKEFVLNQTKVSDASYEMNNHVAFTAYYALKHGISEEDFDAYLDKVVEKTHKKLFNCGCQVSMETPLGNHISKYEGGGDCIRYAKSKFKEAVKLYYEDLYLYNETEEENGKE